MASDQSSPKNAARTAFLRCLGFLLLAVADSFNCSLHKLPLEHRLCTCLEDPEANQAPSPGPGPAPAPDDKMLLGNLSCGRTSWCMCLPKPLLSNSSHTGLVEAPVDPAPIQALFLSHSFEELLHCTGCMCPRSDPAETTAAKAVSSSPAPVPVPAPSSPTHSANGYSVNEEFTLCLSCNCTILYIPSPAPSPSPSPSLPASLAPSPSSDDNDVNDVGSSPRPSIGLDGGTTIGGVYVARRLPPPRVTITNVHSKVKVLAYVLPVVGFAACGIAFITVVLWKNLLWFCQRTSSSSAVSSFSHLENDI